MGRNEESRLKPLDLEDELVHREARKQLLDVVCWGARCRSRSIPPQWRHWRRAF
jgi:hypothetical protein